jgi:hypothetical protein
VNEKERKNQTTSKKRKKKRADQKIKKNPHIIKTKGNSQHHILRNQFRDQEAVPSPFQKTKRKNLGNLCPILMTEKIIIRLKKK